MGMASRVSNSKTEIVKLKNWKNRKTAKLKKNKKLKLKTHKLKNVKKGETEATIQSKYLDQKTFFLGSETINVRQQLWYASLIQHMQTAVVLRGVFGCSFHPRYVW